MIYRLNHTWNYHYKSVDRYNRFTKKLFYDTRVFHHRLITKLLHNCDEMRVFN